MIGVCIVVLPDQYYVPYCLCTTLRGQFIGTASTIICIWHYYRPQQVHYNL